MNVLQFINIDFQLKACFFSAWSASLSVYLKNNATVPLMYDFFSRIVSRIELTLRKVLSVTFLIDS